jgi:hypothetical protein
MIQFKKVNVPFILLNFIYLFIYLFLSEKKVNDPIIIVDDIVFF